MTCPIGDSRAEIPGSQPGTLEAVRVELLGGFRVSVGARIVGEGDWRRRKGRGLVELLCLARRHRLHRERIADLLWPDLEAKPATNNLHRALHSARRTLAPVPSPGADRYLEFRGALLALCPETPLWVDVEAFERAAAAARRRQETSAYRWAIELYTGELLPGDRYEPWVEERRRGLREVYLGLLVELAALYEEQEEPGPAIETLQEVLDHDHCREEAHTRLMDLLAATGRRREAMLQYRRLEQALSEELAAEPNAASRSLHEEILAYGSPDSRARLATPRTQSARKAPENRHNLPNLHTSFVGRERESAEIRRSLAMTGLLTLTGAGGCGKSRLALEVSRDLVGSFPDGVWLAELASLSEPALVAQTVAAALGLPEQPGRSSEEALSHHLRTGQILLVLDNCEHLLDACARLADTLLASCEHLSILATSREPLGVAGEMNWPVPPLAVPEMKGPLPAARHESVRLFEERARSALPTFSLDSRNARSVTRICRKLDGLPLAIELAAARVTALAVEQIAARLEDALGLLTSSNRTADRRHQTLRAALEWSYRLLSKRERRLFERLSVFTGGWTLEAAEAVGAGGGLEKDELLELLCNLVDKSLAVAEASSEAGGTPRYRMLEPVRQYGRERLLESAQEETCRERHARYHLALAETAEPELRGPHQVVWLEALEAEYGNLRAALGWCLDESAGSGQRAQMGLQLAAALGGFWNTYGPGEGRAWLERGLARSETAAPALRARALGEAGFIAIFQGDPRTMDLLEEGLILAREGGSILEVALSVANLGHAVAHSGGSDRLTTLRDEAVALLREPLDRRARAHLLLFLSIAAMSEGDREHIAVRTKEARLLFRALGDLRHVAMSLGVEGISALSQSDSERAAELFEEDLRFLRQLKDKAGLVYGLLGMAGVATLQRRFARASMLWGASEALREVFGLPLTPLVRNYYDYDGYLATVRAELGEAAFEAAWSEGRNMASEEAVEYALGVREPVQQTVSGEHVSERAPQGVLTRRQEEVALLVARGLTNRQVAAELTLSRHTVATHIRGILKRLGLQSRTQLAAWMAEQDPIR
jgi:predicted ATPase/DNA-binding SARP family transcriptional activator/DNA-binding CsgD family transcriptional regulator